MTTIFAVFTLHCLMIINDWTMTPTCTWLRPPLQPQTKHSNDGRIDEHWIYKANTLQRIPIMTKNIYLLLQPLSWCSV